MNILHATYIVVDTTAAPENNIVEVQRADSMRWSVILFLLFLPSVPAKPSPLSRDVDSKPTLRDLERLVVARAASKLELLARSLGVK